MIRSGSEIPNNVINDLYVWKKNIVNNPMNVITNPPINSLFHAIYTITNNSNHGRALGIFCNMPFNPPPSFSEPDNNANINQNVEIIINAVLDVYRKYLAILVLFFTLCSPFFRDYNAKKVLA